MIKPLKPLKQKFGICLSLGLLRILPHKDQDKGAFKCRYVLAVDELGDDHEPPQLACASAMCPFSAF